MFPLKAQSRKYQQKRDRKEGEVGYSTYVEIHYELILLKDCSALYPVWNS